jgi:predicted phosphodiesterase
MHYAILSDIHGNLEALQAILARVATLGANAVVCLGDLVGYNADPNLCLEIMRRESIACVLSNHDTAASSIPAPLDSRGMATRGRPSLSTIRKHGT